MIMQFPGFASNIVTLWERDRGAPDAIVVGEQDEEIPWVGNSGPRGEPPRGNTKKIKSKFEK